MRVLIVEDDALKCAKLTELVREVIAHPELSYAKSYKSGLRAITREPSDLILLDMTLPTFDITDDEWGGAPLPFGGRELLRQMARRRIVVPVIVVTQFEQFESSSNSVTLQDLIAEIQSEFAEILVRTVFYNPTQSRWKDELRAAVELCVGGA